MVTLQVRVNLYAALHDPKVWSDPMTFKPERFLDSEGRRVKPEQWVPFSMGKSSINTRAIFPIIITHKKILVFIRTNLLISFSSDFLIGRRMCLGEQLAKQELFMVFTGILHSYRVVVPEGASPPDDSHGGGIVLKSKPYEVQFLPRFVREE